VHGEVGRAAGAALPGHRPGAVRAGGAGGAADRVGRGEVRGPGAGRGGGGGQGGQPLARHQHPQERQRAEAESESEWGAGVQLGAHL